MSAIKINRARRICQSEGMEATEFDLIMDELPAVHRSRLTASELAGLVLNIRRSDYIITPRAEDSDPGCNHFIPHITGVNGLGYMPLHPIAGGQHISRLA